jgi:sugar fermentation stimulation protein A
LDYRYPSPLVEGTLIRRYKRFLADVALPHGRTLTVHCADPGSMRTVAVAGRPVRIRDAGDPRRKLSHTLEQVRPGRAWVCVNTAVPNAVVEGAVRRGAIEALGGYARLRREAVPFPGSRLDLLLEHGERRCWVEVKNVTLRAGREARFPDSVTARGLKHLHALTRLRRDGDRAVMLFHVARADVDRFRPAWEIDPLYAAALRDAVAAGVEVLPVHVGVRRAGLAAGGLLPCELDPA